MKYQVQPEVMWAIWNRDWGFYTGTFPTRQGMIFLHTQDLEQSWKECQKNGDVAVKVIISAVEP